MITIHLSVLTLTLTWARACKNRESFIINHRLTWRNMRRQGHVNGHGNWTQEIKLFPFLHIFHLPKWQVHGVRSAEVSEITIKKPENYDSEQSQWFTGTFTNPFRNKFCLDLNQLESGKWSKFCSGSANTKLSYHRTNRRWVVPPWGCVPKGIEGFPVPGNEPKHKRARLARCLTCRLHTGAQISMQNTKTRSSSAGASGMSLARMTVAARNGSFSTTKTRKSCLWR